VTLLQGVVVIGALAMGARAGGVGIGMWSGAGVFVLVFVLRTDPGTPPVDAVLILLAVVLAASVLQAAGGLDWMVGLAARVLRRRPGHITYVAPLVTWALGFSAGTGNVIYPVLPIIFDVAYHHRIRPSRPLTMSVVAIVLSLVCSPVSAATAALLSLVGSRGLGVELADVLKITIPSVLVGIVAGSAVVNRLGADLDDDPGYLRRLEAGTVPPSGARADEGEPAPGPDGVAPGGRTAVLVFACGLLTVIVLGLFPGLRPAVSSGGEAGRLDMPLVIPMVMFATCAVIVILCRPDLSEIPDLSVFRAGMTSAFALFGVAWLADTFIGAHEDEIVVAIGGWVVEQPWVFVVAVFVVAALTLSQSTTVRVIVPIGLATGLSPAMIVASLPAVGGAVVLAGATGQAVAAVNFDRSGTTSLGGMLMDNSFVVPAVATVVPAVCCGFVLSHFV
jgi:anaerobic C4-dicarboxylate transporter DcuB